MTGTVHPLSDESSPEARASCLADLVPTRRRERISPLSRKPAVANIGDVWHTAGHRGPGQLVAVDRPADIDPTGPTCRPYAGWAALVDEAAAALYAAGVRPWDRVAILKRNHLDVALLACAAARLGAVPAQLSGSYGPDVAATLLARLDRPFLVTDAEHRARCGIDPDLVARLTAGTVSVDDPGDRTDLVPLDSLRGAPPAPTRLRAGDEPMVVTHTSGTTGIPKLVVHCADSAYALALVEAERWPLFGLRKEDRVAFCDPFSHQRMTTGLLAMATVTPTLLALSEPRAAALGERLARYRPTVVETLPNVYLRWEALARDTGAFAGVRLYINSFDAIHTRTIRAFLGASRRRLPVWVQSWSQSEAGAMVIRPYTRRTVRRRGHRPPPTQVLGWPIPGLCRVRTVDPDSGRRTRLGEPGLVQVSQPGRSLGYVGEQPRHDLKRDGDWWNTGDMGVLSRLGAVRLLDREIDRIDGASGLEIEDVLLDRLPETTEVVVLAVAGGRPVPVYSTASDQPVDPRRWRRATAGLPALAEPVHIGWDDFPRTGTWKIRRVELRRRLLRDRAPVGIGRWT
ncbi:MAG: AMP-binding protein [Mycobacteriales bacterium]